ncbi:methyltransferase domain-containing protein [Mycobacterium sp.]|uniref:class I SAM-dependent methyltransferase n=1 Tax=Mycobacterium sp. TaxID=1785 RepID=UPI0031CDB7DC
MTSPARRGFNSAVTRFWSVAAPAYDQPWLQRWVYRPAHDEVIAALRAHESQRIADIACGTGILADRIQRELQPADVCGVDMSDGMLRAARARSPRVRWLRGPAEQLPFDDGALDAVVTTSAFHFFDQPAALREFHRVLRPGGLAAVSTLSARQPLLQAPVGSRWKPAHHPSAEQLRTLFADAGFEIRDQHPVRRAPWTRLVNDVITIGIKGS